MSREWAEGFARLDPDHPPGDVPIKRWRLFVDACGKFLDEGWAARASELGWGVLDIFGCDLSKPFARIDGQGLAWFLHDAMLAKLERDKAVLRMATGAEQVVRRKLLHDAKRVVPAWELASKEQ